MEGCAFANFGNSSGTEGETSQKREKIGEEKENINAAATGNRTRDPSITDIQIQPVDSNQKFVKMLYFFVKIEFLDKTLTFRIVCTPKRVIFDQ